ncbi:MAG: hypothetical protein ACTSUC_04650 [Promethearchaeota archaeon]
MSNLNKLNIRDFIFNQKRSKLRLDKAKKFFGEKVLVNILCLCLYLFGMKRNIIALILGISENTVRAKIRIFFMDGADSLHDRRERGGVENIKQQAPASNLRGNITVEKNAAVTIINLGETPLTIPNTNHLQIKVVLLTLVENKLITKSEGSRILNISSNHISHLCNNLTEKDITCLIDHRKGLQKEYKFTPEVKSELIEEFVVSSLMGRSISGRSIAEHLSKKMQVFVSERSARLHMQKLGINRIKKSLPERYNLEKKTLRNNT